MLPYFSGEELASLLVSRGERLSGECSQTPKLHKPKFKGVGVGEGRERGGISE